MAKRTYLTAAAALMLLAACNGPSAPQPTPPARPDLETAPADLPPPAPLLGGPSEEEPDDQTLAGGPYASADRPGPLTTFRRPDGVEVTVMRPIPNPEDGGPAPPRHHVRDRIGDLLAQADQPRPEPRVTPPEAPGKAVPGEALAPTQPLPPPKVVEQAKRATPPHGVRHQIRIKPPTSPKDVVAPPTAAQAKPSLVDHLSDDKVRTPGGETTPKALLGGLLVLVAMVLLVAIARRMARAREARERARRSAKRAATEAAPPETQAAPAPAAEAPPEPKPEP